MCSTRAFRIGRNSQFLLHVRVYGKSTKVVDARPSNLDKGPLSAYVLVDRSRVSTPDSANILRCNLLVYGRSMRRLETVLPFHGLVRARYCTSTFRTSIILHVNAGHTGPLEDLNSQSAQHTRVGRGSANLHVALSEAIWVGRLVSGSMSPNPFPTRGARLLPASLF